MAETAAATIATQTIEVVFYDGLNRTQAQPETLTLTQLRALLTTHDERADKDGRLISPVILKLGFNTRSNEAVAFVTGLMADLDETFTLEAAVAMATGYNAILYSTHRHGTAEKPGEAAPGERYRILFLLDTPIPTADWPVVWQRFNRRFFNELDHSCSDESRAYYLPSYPPGAAEFAVAMVFDGPCLRVDDLPSLPANWEKPVYTPMPAVAVGEGRPGDDYDAQNANNENTAALLEAGGFTVYRSQSHVWKVRRPGKQGRGICGTLGFLAPGVFYNFSDSAPPFAARHAYRPWQVFTFIEHGGDFKAAARALAEQGYGEQRANPFQLKRVTIESHAPGQLNGKAENNGHAPHEEHEGREQAESASDPATLLLGYPLTDTGNAERFISQWGNDVRYCHPWNKWLTWTGHGWERDELGIVHQWGKETVRRIYTEAAMEADSDKRPKVAAWAFQSESRKRRADMIDLASKEQEAGILPGELDRHPWLFNCANGTVDLKTAQLRPHCRADLLTMLSPVAYDADAKCPLFLAFMHSTMQEREELVNFLQVAIGYTLTGITREQCFFIFYGMGSNGKSTLLNVLMWLLGSYGCSAKEEVLMVKRYENANNDEVAMLRGARLVTATETDEDKRFSEARVKQLTGSEPITVCRKYEHPFTFTPEFKIFFGTNHRPAIRSTDDGIWRRPRLVPFDVKFWNPEKGEMGDEKLRADKLLPDKLKAELPGILAWAVRGCLKWQDEGLIVPKPIKDATESYRQEQDVIAAFLADFCIQQSDAMSTARELYVAYCRWCEESSIKAISQISLAKRFREKGFVDDRGHGGKRIWRGIGILEAAKIAPLLPGTEKNEQK